MARKRSSSSCKSVQLPPWDYRSAIPMCKSQNPREPETHGYYEPKVKLLDYSHYDTLEFDDSCNCWECNNGTPCNKFSCVYCSNRSILCTVYSCVILVTWVLANVLCTAESLTTFKSRRLR